MSEESKGAREVRVDFACNDDRGNCLMKAERIEIGELELECTLIGGGVMLRDLGGFLWVGRKKFKHHGHKYGVGNWCWCAWWLAEADVAEVLNYLERQKYWACTCGPEKSFDKFNAKQPFTANDLTDFLEEK